jgi:segregation and condensation protein A
MNYNLLAKIQGQELKEFPKDLYIPPDAMLVVLEIFEGPLDLLLYLIRKQNLDILDIKVALITKQYVEYIELMQYANLELTADYLEMAAILTEIKSKMLLPKLHALEQTEEDPRHELIKRLQEYEQIKTAAENLDQLPRLDRDFFIGHINQSTINLPINLPEIQLSELLTNLKTVLSKADLRISHTVSSEHLSVRDKMTNILVTLQAFPNKFFMFSDFFNIQEGRLGIVVTFLAILELVKENLLEIMQSEPFAPIYIKNIKQSELELC